MPRGPRALAYVRATARSQTYPAMYIIPQSILKQAIARPSWTQDVYQPWREFNVYFQHHWLSHHVRMAIPLVAFRQSLIHHGSDR